jgi:hypothetical protein
MSPEIYSRPGTVMAVGLGDITPPVTRGLGVITNDIGPVPARS